MSRRELTRAKLCSIGFFAAICAIAWLTLRHGVTLSPKLAQFPRWPVLLDLWLTAPAFAWWLHRRDRTRAWRNAIAMAALGLLAARYLIPDLSSAATRDLSMVRMLALSAAGAIECLLLMRTLRWVMRTGRGENPEYALQRSIENRFGKSTIARAISFESRMWLYFLMPARLFGRYRGDQHFGYHLKDGYAVNLQGLCVLLLVGLPAQHFLLQLFSHSLAWITDLLTLYALLFLRAHYRACLHCPVSLDEQNLYLRYGLKMREKIIPLASIAAIESWREPPVRRKHGALNFSGVGSANVQIILREALPVEGLYGIIKPVRTVYLGLDQPGAFLKAVDALHSDSVRYIPNREVC
jgi:hypothetical protein